MKLSAFVAAAAVIGGSFLIPVPAEARNGWQEAGCDNYGDCLYVRKTSRSGSIAKFQTKLTGSNVYSRTGNCRTWQVSRLNGGMKDVMPGTLIEGAMDIACR